MGKLADTLELLKLGAQVSASKGVTGGVSASSVGVLTPWSEQVGLAKVIAAEIGYGTNGVSRAEALSVPAIAKGRGILHALIVGRPLRALDRTGLVDPQPTWLYRSDTGIAPEYRMTCILDDLIFGDGSGLLVNRSEVDRTRILDAVHVPRARWTVDEFGRVWIDGVLVDEPDAFVFIPGPGPGLLNQAADHIRAAKDLDRAWQARARNPFPAMELHEVDDSAALTEDEAKAYVQAVAEARRNPDAAVMFTPHNIDLRSHAAEVTDFYDGGRNALRLDFANFLNLPASLLEGSQSTATLTYSTQEGKRNEVFDYSVNYWVRPIETALSTDRVCPRGQRIRFDFTDLESTTATPTGAPTED